MPRRADFLYARARRDRPEQRSSRQTGEHTVCRTRLLTRTGSLGIFVDTRAYSAVTAGAVGSGTYEGRERTLAGSILQPTDRILEIGTAGGLVAMTAGAITSPDSVMTYDANRGACDFRPLGPAAAGHADIHYSRRMRMKVALPLVQCNNRLNSQLSEYQNASARRPDA
jgi:hypothetical protein